MTQVSQQPAQDAKPIKDKEKKLAEKEPASEKKKENEVKEKTWI